MHVINLVSQILNHLLQCLKLFTTQLSGTSLVRHTKIGYSLLPFSLIHSIIIALCWRTITFHLIIVIVDKLIQIFLYILKYLVVQQFLLLISPLFMRIVIIIVIGKEFMKVIVVLLLKVERRLELRIIYFIAPIKSHCLATTHVDVMSWLDNWDLREEDVLSLEGREL